MNNRNNVVEEHYRKNFRGYVKYMSRRAPNNSIHIAEEIVQEAYSRALKHFKAYNSERGSFSTWFNHILHNTLNKVLAEEAGVGPSLDDEEVELEPFILDSETYIPKHLVVKIQQGIKSQKPEVADVLHMFFNLGMKTRDIEECTEFSHSNIRKMIERFRVKWDDENFI